MDGNKTSAADLIAELSTLPLLGERQVFAVSNIQKYKPTEQQQIFKMLSPPDRSRIVIFTSPPAKVPKKSSAFYKAIAKVAETVEFRKLNEPETMSLIKGRLEKGGLTINSEALQVLSQLLGGNRGGLDGETAKLIDYVEPGSEITVKEIKAVCSGYEVFDMFRLADRIIAGKSHDALQMTLALLSEGVSPATLTTLLQQHFTSIYLVKNGKKPVGNRAFLIRNFQQQGRNYSEKRLEQIIVEIARVDSELRQSLLKPKTALQKLVLGLAGDNKSMGG